MLDPDYDQGMYESYYALHDEVEKLYDQIGAGDIYDIEEVYTRLGKILDEF